MNPKIIYKSKDPFDLGITWTVVRDFWHYNTEDFHNALRVWCREVIFVIKRRFNKDQMAAFKELQRIKEERK
jgi:hypothetical protein